MEERYKLLLTVLRELSNAEVLDDLILAGSWCQFYYRILFDEAPEIPLIRTTDIDFLVRIHLRSRKVLMWQNY
jgi:hypothetical protein